MAIAARLELNCALGQPESLESPSSFFISTIRSYDIDNSRATLYPSFDFDGGSARNNSALATSGRVLPLWYLINIGSIG
jgi:hypothetical protein